MVAKKDTVAELNAYYIIYIRNIQFMYCASWIRASGGFYKYSDSAKFFILNKTFLRAFNIILMRRLLTVRCRQLKADLKVLKLSPKNRDFSTPENGES